MEQFKSYLLSSPFINEKKAGFYLYWVTHFYAYCNKRLGYLIAEEDIERYLKHISKSRKEWQVKQAA